MKRVTQSVLSLAILIMASSVMAQGLTGYYQSLGLSGGSTSTVGLSNYGSSNTYTPNYNNYNFNTPSTNYNSVGSNTFNTNYSNTGGTGGLSAYYSNSGFNNTVNTAPTGTVYVNSNSDARGGFTQYFGQNLQANSFAYQCSTARQPDPSTCSGGQFRPIVDNYGCTIDYSCEGGTYCPAVEVPNAAQCNGEWEPQYNAVTQCLTHYFCDRTPDEPTYCPAVMDPVCGQLNGRQITYNNRCRLEAAGARFLYEGQCSTYPDPDVRPVINRFNGPSALTVGETGTWNVTASHPTDRAVEFSINWGDQARDQGSYQRQVRFGSQQSFTKAYDREGTYQVTVTATADGQSVSRTLTVRVTEPYGGGNQAPVMHGITGPTTLNVNQTGTWRVRASDPQNQDLRYQINWGDRYQYGAQARYSSDAGFVQNSAFTHQYSQPGTYTVSITVMNAAGKTARTTTTVRVNDEPIYEPYDYPDYDYYQGRYNRYQNNGSRHSFFNRSYNWR